MEETDWKSMPHEMPKQMEKYLMLICEAGSAKNELVLLGRYQKILRKIYDDLFAIHDWNEK